MNEIEVYNVAWNYLKELTPSEVDLSAYFLGENRNYKSINDVFVSLIASAQNYQSMPNTIQFSQRKNKLEELLEGFDVTAVSNMTVSELYYHFRDVFNVKTPDTKRNSWYKWSCSIIDSAKFLKSFDSVEDFDAFVRSFQYNETTRMALPLVMQSKIRGIGFALACDALKELGYLEYPKPDVHLMDVLHSAYLCEYNQISTFEAIVRMSEACKVIDNSVTPYKVDKIIWLICSGSYYREGIKIKSHKKELIQRISSNESAI